VCRNSLSIPAGPPEWAAGRRVYNPAPRGENKQTFPQCRRRRNARSGYAEPRGMNKGICSNFSLAYRSLLW